MKIRTTLALSAAALALGVPVAAADPDGYQPDAVDRYVANALAQADQPDALDRYLRNHSSGADSALDSTGAARHPDSRAVRPGASVISDRTESAGLSWEIGAIGALGGALILLLAVVGASAMRERRRLALR
jgi:hypothetical protein